MKTKGIALLSGLFLLFINSCGSNSDQGNTEINNQQTSGGISSRPQDIPNNVPAEVLADLPPDPGEAGRATLEGIDSDGDGVRDDIQRYIAINYHTSEKIRAVLTKDAKIFQRFLLEADDKEKSRQNAKKILRGIDCLHSILGNTLEVKGIYSRRLAEYLNTYDRSKAYLKADAQCSGEMFPLESTGNPDLDCGFNVSDMKD